MLHGEVLGESHVCHPIARLEPPRGLQGSGFLQPRANPRHRHTRSLRNRGGFSCPRPVAFLPLLSTSKHPLLERPQAGADLGCTRVCGEAGCLGGLRPDRSINLRAPSRDGAGLAWCSWSPARPRHEWQRCGGLMRPTFLWPSPGPEEIPPARLGGLWEQSSPSPAASKRVEGARQPSPRQVHLHSWARGCVQAWQTRGGIHVCLHCL